MASTSRETQRARTAQVILDAAREEFATRGFEAATIRRIAAAAGVDASLVMQHYGSKAALFAVAVQLPPDDEGAAAQHLLDVLAVRLDDLPVATRALVRSMLTVPEAADVMRAFLDERVENLTRSFDGEDAQRRAVLVVSAILGLTITQHFLHLRAFEDISGESLLGAAQSFITSIVDEPRS